MQEWRIHLVLQVQIHVRRQKTLARIRQLIIFSKLYFWNVKLFVRCIGLICLSSELKALVCALLTRHSDDLALLRGCIVIHVDVHLVGRPRLELQVGGTIFMHLLVKITG